METAKTAKMQDSCPITGEKINRDIHVDYKGKRIYFCCPNCPELFMKEPEKFMKAFREKNVQLEDSPKEKAGATGR